MIRINLLPVREAKQRQSGKQMLLLAVVLIVAEVGGLFYWTSEQESELKRVKGDNDKTAARLEKLLETAEKVTEIEAEKEELLRQKNVLDGLVEAQTGPVYMLDELAFMLTPATDAKHRLLITGKGWTPDWEPKHLWIQSFDENERGVKIDGYAKSNDDVAEFLQRLNTSRHFVQVTLNFSELVEIKGVKAVNFNIEALVLYGRADVERLAKGDLGPEAAAKRKQQQHK